MSARRRFRAAAVLITLFVASAVVALVAPEQHAVADAPPCRYTFPGDGTVVDVETGLTWVQSATVGNMTQASAAAYCQNLSIAGGGFRIANVDELHTIVDPTRSNPALDPTAFPDSFVVPTMWTGTPKAGTAGAEYWVMDPNTGTLFTLQSNFAGGPRCVR